MSARSKASRRLEPTPWHTVGPYFGITVNGANSIGSIAPPNAKGERVKLVCAVFDRDGKRVPDTLIEIWQANAEGKYNHPADTQAKPIDPGFVGFGRQITNENGECKFETIKPGRVPGPRGTLQAPHLEVGVFTRGVMKHLVTRIYFSGDAGDEECPVLGLVPKTRRATLTAQAGCGRARSLAARDTSERAEETVFFDV